MRAYIFKKKIRLELDLTLANSYCEIDAISKLFETETEIEINL